MPTDMQCLDISQRDSIANRIVQGEVFDLENLQSKAEMGSAEIDGNSIGIENLDMESC